jgi:hypothetical protein
MLPTVQAVAVICLVPESTEEKLKALRECISTDGSGINKEINANTLILNNLVINTLYRSPL